jgi:molybdopterin converting factor small subunit
MQLAPPAPEASMLKTLATIVVVLVAAVLADLDRRYAGIRFRMIDEQNPIRPHIRIFVNGEQVRDLSQPLRATDDVVIVQALSGG